MIWACTSGSFVVGRAGAERQVAALRVASGRPATSTSIAIVDALVALGARRIAVVATYPEAAALAFQSFLDSFGIAVTSLQWLDARSGLDAAMISQDRVEAAVRQAASENPDAVLIPDTALPTMGLVERLEASAGCPVVTANQATLWAAVGLAAHPAAIAGPGRLFALAFKECRE